MSYTILYRSMFVKMSDGRFIPMVEMGDNNVWEAGNRRRARGWQQWSIGKGNAFPVYTREEIMADVERMIDHEKERVGLPYADYEHKNGCYTDQEIEKNFGYYSCIAIEGRHCNNTSAQMVRNFFLKGFEQAVSFDEDKGDLHIELHWCTEYPHWERRCADTEEELLRLWDELKDSGKSLWLDFRYGADLLYRQHRKRAPKREKKEHTAGFVVTINGHYISKVTPRRYRYTYDVGYAHIYPQRSTAEKLQQRIQRASYRSEVHHVERNADGKWVLAA